MAHDHQLQQAITAELRRFSSQLGAKVVVTVVADDVRLSGELNSFADKFAAAALVTEMDAVRQVTDETAVRLDMGRNQRLLLAARRVTGGASAVGALTSGTDCAEIGVSMEGGLLMITGEFDWRQRLGTVNDAPAPMSPKAVGSNIADDILQLLPRCFFSIPRTAR